MRTLVVFFSLLLFSCSSTTSEPIKINTDACHFCKMTISNGHFGSEILTTKGRHYKFDDVLCMLSYVKQEKDLSVQSYYINDYLQDNILIAAENAFYLQGGEINSPMRGNTAAFNSKAKMDPYKLKLNAKIVSWQELKDSF